MKVAILDYGAGNLHSLAKAVGGPNVEVVVETDPAAAATADALVLPGVGAFASASRFLAPGRDIIRAALKNGMPCLGICLGMQLLFDSSEEGAGSGLGIIPGRVRRLNAHRVPQMGWNALNETRGDLYDTSRLSTAYFANSFVCEPIDTSTVTAWSTHDGDRFAASVASGHIVGVQFHPEKSSAAGVAFIHAFLDRARR